MAGAALAPTSVYWPMLKGSVEDFRDEFCVLTPYVQEVLMDGMFIRIKVVDTRSGEVQVQMDIMVCSVGDVEIVKDVLKGLLKSYTAHAIRSQN